MVYLTYRVTPKDKELFLAALPSLTEFWKSIPGVRYYANMAPTSPTLRALHHLNVLVTPEYHSFVAFDTQDDLYGALDSVAVKLKLKELRKIATVHPEVQISELNTAWGTDHVD